MTAHGRESQKASREATDHSKGIGNNFPSLEFASWTQLSLSLRSIPKACSVRSNPWFFRYHVHRFVLQRKCSEKIGTSLESRQVRTHPYGDRQVLTIPHHPPAFLSIIAVNDTPHEGRAAHQFRWHDASYGSSAASVARKVLAGLNCHDKRRFMRRLPSSSLGEFVRSVKWQPSTYLDSLSTSIPPHNIMTRPRISWWWSKIAHFDDKVLGNRVTTLDDEERRWC